MPDECRKSRVEMEMCLSGLDLSARARVHLASCEDCRVAHREGEALRRLLGDLDAVEAPADFEFRLRARLSHSRERLGRRRLYPRLAFNFAAAILLVSSFALAFFLYTDASKENNSTSTSEIERHADPFTETAKKETPTAHALSEMELPRRSYESNGNLFEQASRRPSTRRLRSGSLRAREEANQVVAEVAGLTQAESFEQRQAGVIGFTSTGGDDAGTRGVRKSIRLAGQTETLRVVLRDDSGLTRAVPIRSVSFGAQEPFASGDNAKRISFKGGEGVW